MPNGRKWGLDGDYDWITVLKDAHWDVSIGYLTAMECSADRMNVLISVSWIANACLGHVEWFN